MQIYGGMHHQVSFVELFLFLSDNSISEKKSFTASRLAVSLSIVV